MDDADTKDKDESAAPVMCGNAILAADAAKYKCSVEDKATVEKAAADAADVAALELAAVKAAVKDALCTDKPTAEGECPAPEVVEPVEGAEGDEEAAPDAETPEADADAKDTTDCYAKTKDDCSDEESDLSVGHSVSVLSGVLALASALF